MQMYGLALCIGRPGHGIGPAMTALLKPDEVAKRLGISRRTLFSMLERKMFVQPVYLGARTMRFPDNEVEDWIMARLEGRSGASS